MIDPGTFLFMSALNYLDLSSNNIKRLTRVAFERLESLETLLLQVINMFFFKFSLTVYFYVQEGLIIFFNFFYDQYFYD